MNELSTTAKQLPDKLEDLSKFTLIGREKLNAVRAEIRAIEKVGLAKEVHEQKLQEAQEIAEAVLDAEAKIGELTSKMETSQGQRTDIEHIRNGADKSKKAQLQTIGISQDTAERFETLARHPETVEKAKADARAEGRIVTRQDVLNRIVAPRTNSPRKMIKEMRDNARAEHKDHKENAKQGLVDFGEIVKDKNNQEIIALDTSITISKALSSVTSIGFISSEDINVMVKNMEPDGKKDMIHRIRESIKILDHLITKIGG